MKQLYLTLFETLSKNILSSYRLHVFNSTVKSDQRGQGLIEYMLMLVIIVAMVIGLNRALGEPLRDYTKNYVGDMVRCIIDTGELPQRAMEICGISISVSFSEFSIETSGGGNSGFRSSSSSNTSDRDSSSDSDESEGNEGSGSESEPKSKASSNELRAQPKSNFNAIDGASDRSDSNEKILSKGSSGEISGDGEGSNGKPSNGNKVTVIRRKSGQGIGGTYSLGGDTSSKKENPKPAPINISRKLDVKDDGEIKAPKGPQTFVVGSENDRGPAGEQDDEMGGFSFGKLLKWGIILAILIVFGVFMMNQLNTIRKGWTS